MSANPILTGSVTSSYSVFLVFCLLLFTLIGCASILLLKKEELTISVFDLPFHISIGVVVFTAISIIISLIRITGITILVSSLLSIIIIIKNRERIIINRETSSQKTDSYFWIITLITLGIFWRYGQTRIWAPVGDVVTAHAPLVMQLMTKGHLPLNVENLGILYPPGFHILSATLNQVFNYLSPKIVFNVAIFLTTLIPLILFSLVYRITDSFLLSCSAYLMSWYMNPSNADRFFIGPLYNGTYSFLFGFILVLGYVFLVQDLHEMKEDEINSFLVFSAIYLFSLLFVYPTFFIFCSILSFGFLLKNREIIWKYYTESFLIINRRKFIGGTTVFLFSFLGLLFFYPQIYNLAYYITGIYAYLGDRSLQLIPSQYVSYKVDFWIYSTSTFGIISYFALLIGLTCKKIRNSSLFTMFFFSLSVTLLSATSKYVVRVLALLTPLRSALITDSLGILVLLHSVSYYFTECGILRFLGFQVRLFGETFDPSFKIKSVMFSLILITSSIMFGPFFITQTRLNINGVLQQTQYASDIEGHLWITANSDSDDVILTEPTWIGWYGQSLSYAENVHHPYWYVMDQQRDRDLWQIWLTPENENKVHSLLKEYDVTYLMLTTSSYHVDLNQAELNDFRFTTTYIEIFENYNFLEPVFTKENTRIYRVNKES